MRATIERLRSGASVTLGNESIADTSSGCEPDYSLIYVKRCLDGDPGQWAGKRPGQPPGSQHDSEAREESEKAEGSLDGRTLMVALSFSPAGGRTTLPAGYAPGRVLMNNLATSPMRGAELVLEPYQAIVLELMDD